METDFQNRPWHPVYADIAKKILAGEKIKLARFQFSKICPFECNYCYRAGKGKGELVPHHIVSIIINRLIREGWKVVPVIAELVPAIEPYLHFYQECNINEISTTGHPLNAQPEWFNILEKHGIDGLRITVFPDEKIHKQWTGTKRTDVLKAIENGLKHNFYITWNFLLSHQTRKYLPAQIRDAIYCGVQKFHINLFFSGGRGSALENEMLSAEEVTEMLKEYEEIRSTYGDQIKITRNSLMGPGIPENSISALLATRNQFCIAGMGDHGQMIYIDADRNIYGCLCQLGNDLRIGIVNEDGELIFNGNDPLSGFDRKNCFIVQYTRKQALLKV